MGDQHLLPHQVRLGSRLNLCSLARLVAYRVCSANCSAAVQPLYGQLANIFGRRWVTLSSIVIFLLGSGICGGANGSDMLIAGRAVQGVGAGGINTMIDLIVCDLVPLRERGTFVGILFLVVTVGSAIAPYVGGAIVENISWRWAFYINLPIGGVSMVLLFAFLHVNYKKEFTFLQKVKRIDFIGNAILMASTVAILFALTYGGTRYPWSSWRIILPLVLGLAGLLLAYPYERSSLCKEPVIPPVLFGNRTSATAFFLTFQHSVITFWMIYFLPVYFQAVLGSSPTRSGVQLLPTVTVFAPFAAIAGALVTKFGRYRPFHHLGFGVTTIAMGCFTLLDESSSTAMWVIFQVIAAAGLGLVMPSLLPAVQADLPESEAASSTGTWAYIRSLGIIWGVSIPAAIFNNRFSELSGRISDSTVRNLLSNGQAYERASKELINSFQPAVRREVIGVYVDSLKRVWQIVIVFAGISFLAVFAEKEIKLRTSLETEHGLIEKKKEKSVEGGLNQKGKKDRAPVQAGSE